MRTDRLDLHRVHPDETEFDRLHALFADAEDLDDRTGQWERRESFEYVRESAADGEYVGTVCLEVSAGDESGISTFVLVGRDVFDLIFPERELPLPATPSAVTGPNAATFPQRRY